MPTYLPSIDRDRFVETLRSGRARTPVAGISQVRSLAEGSLLTDEAIERLWQHYETLRKWSSGTALIGPGTAEDALERHYLESLAGVDLIPEGAQTMVDVGSGAGFPGFVLASVLPAIDSTLVEPRQRKWAFLEAAARAASLPCRCLNARVADQLPSGIPARIDILTMRALKLPSKALAALVERLTTTSRLLLWTTGDIEPIPGLAVVDRLKLSGSDRRWIAAFKPSSVESDRSNPR